MVLKSVRKTIYLLAFTEPSIWNMLPEEAALSSDNAAKDAWAHDAATLGPIADARKATLQMSRS